MSTCSRRLVGTALLLALVAGLVLGANGLLVNRPVQQALNSDPRNDSFTLKARFQGYLRPSVLVMDLVSVDETSLRPLDLFRAVFQSAAALYEVDRDFDTVVLARNGKAVFQLEGESFAEIGFEYSVGQNPVYLIRTLPEKLYDAEGTQAFGTWTGGILGVLGEQMEDANEAALAWYLGDFASLY